MSSAPRSLRHSLFFNIFVLFALGAGLTLIVASLAGRFLYSVGERPRVLGQKYVVGVQNFLMKEIPALATPEAWRDFLNRHPELEVAVWQDRNLVFSSLSEPIDLARFDDPRAFQDGTTRLLRDGPRVYAMSTQDRLTIVFCQDFHPSRGTIAKTFLVLIVLLGSVFWLVHRFVTGQLAPIRDLQQGTHEIQQGNYRFRLGDVPSEEFADLVDSFNAMAEKLETTFVNNTLMIGNLSHDLKAYLTRLRMTTEVEVQDPAVKTSLTEDIHSLSRYLDRTLEAFRSSSDQASFRFEPVVVGAFLKEVIAQQIALHPGKTIAEEIPPEPVTALLDPHFTRILLVNLLDNAFAYGEAITASLVAAEGRFTLTVSNRPLGTLDPADLPFLSQPFFRPEKARQIGGGHSGLGLYISRKIAEAHRLAFGLDLADGRFRVTLTGPVV